MNITTLTNEFISKAQVKIADLALLVSRGYNDSLENESNVDLIIDLEDVVECLKSPENSWSDLEKETVIHYWTTRARLNDIGIVDLTGELTKILLGFGISGEWQAAYNYLLEYIRRVETSHDIRITAIEETLANLGDGNIPQDILDKINEAYNLRHSHANKGVIDQLTQTMIDNMVAFVNHIQDTTIHITAQERTTWNAKVSTQTLTTALAGKSDVNHVHEIADVNGLQDALDALSGQTSLPTFNVGTVVNGAAPNVTIDNTNPAQPILNFTFVKGDKGDTGADGKSAYQIWLDLGNTGTEQDFIDYLRGIQSDYKVYVVDTYAELTAAMTEAQGIGAALILFGASITIPDATVFSGDFSGIKIDLSGYTLTVGLNSLIKHISSKTRTTAYFANGTIKANKATTGKTFFESDTTRNTKITFNNISFDDIVHQGNSDDGTGHIKVDSTNTYATRVEFYDNIIYTNNESINNYALVIDIGNVYGLHIFATRNKFTGNSDRSRKIATIGLNPVSAPDTDFVYDGSWEKVTYGVSNVPMSEYNIYDQNITAESDFKQNDTAGTGYIANKPMHLVYNMTDFDNVVAQNSSDDHLHIMVMADLNLTHTVDKKLSFYGRHSLSFGANLLTCAPGVAFTQEVNLYDLEVRGDFTFNMTAASWYNFFRCRFLGPTLKFSANSGSPTNTADAYPKFLNCIAGSLYIEDGDQYDKTFLTWIGGVQGFSTGTGTTYGTVTALGKSYITTDGSWGFTEAGTGSIFRYTIHGPNVILDLPAAQGADGEIFTIMGVSASGDIRKKDLNFAQLSDDEISYEFLSNSVWTINHNLNRHPAVVVTDSAGTLLTPSITYTSANQIIITHQSPIAGKAYLVK